MTKRGISDFKHIRDLGEGKIGSVGVSVSFFPFYLFTLPLLLVLQQLWYLISVQIQVYEFSQGSGLLFKALCLSSDKWKHLQGKQIAIKKIHRNFPEAYATEKRVLERLGKISESGLVSPPLILSFLDLKICSYMVMVQIRYYGAEEDRENYYLFMELGKYGDLLSVAGRLFEIPGPQSLMSWRRILWQTLI